MGQANINRGEKWSLTRRDNELMHNDKDNKWMLTQPSIVADIKEYEDSLQPKVQPKVQPKEEPKEEPKKPKVK